MSINIERFFARVEGEANTGCWLWSGRVNYAGYGCFDVRRFPELAHRVSWLLHRGEIGEGLFVCHKCDTPACVNPDHLFLGTHSDNMRDMVAKGRHGGSHGTRYGEHHASAKLSDEAVRHIRRREMRAIEYAKLYQVSRSHISGIQSGRVRRAA